MTARKVKLGFAMDGLEEAVTKIVQDISDEFERVTYLEIGVGHGETLAGIASVLAEENEDWRAIGVELPDGYSFHRKQTETSAERAHIKLSFVDNCENLVTPSWNCITVVMENSHKFLAEHWQGQIQLALIDGCHGKKCAMLDFLLLEPYIPEGGIVMFHDFGRDQIGQSQPHCGKLDVYGACKDLGLLGGNRKNWRFVSHLIGDKAQGSGDMGVFQKV